MVILIRYAHIAVAPYVCVMISVRTAEDCRTTVHANRAVCVGCLITIANARCVRDACVTTLIVIAAVLFAAITTGNVLALSEGWYG